MGLLKFKAPSLPIPTTEYSQDQQQQRDNALRIYFNQLDNANWDGRLVINPYGAIQDSTDQYAAAANTATQVLFNTTDYVNEMTHVTNDGLTVVYSGIYNYQFSIQFANTDNNAIHEATVWLKKKATGAGSSSNVAGTGSKFSIPGNHSTSDGYLCVAANFYLQLDAGDTVELWWEGTQTATSGGVKGIYIEHYAAAGHLPSIPSAVATLSFVSAIP